MVRFPSLTLLLIFSSQACNSFTMNIPNSKKTSSPIITSSGVTADSPSSTINQLQFDVGCVANPVIVPPFELNSDTDDGEWQCYYYGNAGFWNGGRKCFLPTGSSELAVSNNGCVTWTKIAGKNSDGSVLGPSNDGDAKWDEVQTGVGDVIRVGKDELHMYYFGASTEELSFGPGSMEGFRMRIGRAKSFDNGRTWTKDATYLLDYDESEGFFASWPRIVVPDDESKPWSMYYHSFTGQKWRVYRAESHDRGDSWLRTGLILEGGKSEDDFDYRGIGTRSVIKWKDGYLMVYEGVDKENVHRLGAAFSKDGKKWSKLQEGRPILEPGKSPLGSWTKQVIGTPFLVKMPDGCLRLFHCGKSGSDSKMAIGVVESKSGEVGPECWTAL